MRSKKSRILSILLAVVMVVALVPISSMKANAMTLSEFETKLSTFRTTRYGHNSYYIDNPDLTGGYQCFGFANELSLYMYGSYPTASMSASWTNYGWTVTYGGTGIDNLCVGDVVRFQFHSIFITGISGDTIYYAQANVPDGTNLVTYGNSMSRSYMKSLVNQYLWNSDTGKTGWVAHYYNGVVDSSTLSIQYDANGGMIEGSDVMLPKYTVASGTTLNMRSGAGTSYGTVGSIDAGVSFGVTETATADGYTWGKTTYNGVTGWCVISESWTSSAGTIPATTYYLNASGMVYKSSTGKVNAQQMDDGTTYSNGLTDYTTMGISRPGYTFMGWGTKETGGTIYSQSESMTAAKLYPNISSGNATITLYAIWESAALAECTSYAANLDVLTKVNTAIMTLPNDGKDGSGSAVVENVAPDTVLFVTGLYENADGEYWYQVVRYGSTGYVKANDVTMTAHKTGDVEGDDVRLPASLGVGKGFYLKGEVSSTLNKLESLKLTMHNGSYVTTDSVLENSDTVTNNYYNLDGSDLCDGLWFSSLAAGDYACVLSADAVSYYVDDNGALVKSTQEVVIKKTQCIINGQVNTSTATAFGIDVSTWQDVDWSQASQEIDFAIFRSSFATTTDSQFYANLEGCETYGVPFGLYVYSYAENVQEAEDEAYYVLDLIEGHDLAFPIYFDMEDAVIDVLSDETKELLCKTFCDIIEDAGYEAGLYTSTMWLENYYENSNYIHSLPIWCAQWYTTCQYAGGVRMWQNSETGSVAGISGDVDTDYYYGEFPGTNSDTSYLGKCTSYPSNLKVTTNVATTMKLYPCASSVDSTSTNVATVAAATELQVTGLYKNTNNEYWYQVEDGTNAGYVLASDTTLVTALYDDVTVTEQTMADYLASGNGYWLDGKFNSRYNDMQTVYGKIYSGEQTTGTPVMENSDTVSDKFYNIKGSDLDDGLWLNTLDAGYYTYELSADVTNYYVSNGALTSETQNVVVWNKPFTVGSETISHTHTEGAAVTENVVEGVSYDSVTYCTGCNTEMSRETISDGSNPEVAVTSVTLDKTSASMTVGDTVTLTATVAPDNATNKTVTWTSSNKAVATVDQNGVVTAVGAGSATISAQAGNIIATCAVAVSTKQDGGDEPEQGDGNTEVSEGTFYRSNINVLTTKATALMTNPWSAETNVSSKVHENVAADTVLFVEGVYQNTVGEYWYKVVRFGETCYVKATDTVLKDHKTGDITAKDMLSPAALGYGTGFNLGGTVSASLNEITKITAAMHNRLDITTYPALQNSDTITSNSYNLKGSDLCDGLWFSGLSGGDYTYVVTVEAVSYYVDANGVLTSSTTQVVVEQKQCIITDANNPNKSTAFGVDLSTWQSGIDWATASQYIDFAILRASFATTTDNQFYSHANGCTKYGVPFGVYVYSYAETVDEAIAEANYVLEVIKGYDLALPIYFDFEDECQSGLSTSQITAIVKAFCTTIQEAGYEAGIYSFLGWFNSYFTDPYFDTLPKWVAQLYDTCTYTDGVRMWQYSWTGSIPGMSGEIDCNYYYGEFLGQSSDTSYLSKCTSYPSNLKVTGNANATIKTYPCYYAVDNTSLDVVTLTKATELHVTGLYKNTIGEYWYQVETGSTAGYIAASETTLVNKLYDDISVKEQSMADNLAVGTGYWLDGEVSSKYNEMQTIYGKIYSGEQTTATAVLANDDTVGGKFYNIVGSDMDDGLWLNTLSAGYYTYEISADVTNYYVSDGALTSETENVVVWTKPFTVGDATHIHTEVADAAVAPTCTATGLTAGSHCSECGAVIIAQTVVATTGHTAGKEVHENVVDGVSYDKVVYCSVCGEEMSRETVALTDSTLKINGATLELENDISVLVNSKTTTVGSYTNPYIIVVHELKDGETKETKVEGILNDAGDTYVFRYEGVEAKQVGDSFVCTIYAYDANGYVVKGVSAAPYSAKTYCTNTISKNISNTDSKSTALVTLLVDLLNYSAEAQKYFGYKTDSLVNAGLSADILAKASSDSVLDSLENITSATYETIENPTATFKGATLQLQNKVYVQTNVVYEGDMSNVKAVFTVDGVDYEIAEYTSNATNTYSFVCDDVTAFQFEEPIYIKIMDGDTAISNTACYSVGSYAASYKNNATVGAVVCAMMKYGKAAMAYKNAK